MKRFTFLVAVILSATANFVGQPPSPSPLVEVATPWGVVEDGTFKSQRLKLTLPIPKEYSLISTVEAEVLSNAGTDLLKQGSSKDSSIDEAVGRTIKLIAFSEKPIGAPQNASLELVAVKQQAGVTARMNLAANLMLLRGTVFKLKRSLGSLKLGTNTFAAAELEALVNGLSFFQRMYVIMHHGYSLVCAITYSTDKQRAALEKVLSTLVLSK